MRVMIISMLIHNCQVLMLIDAVFIEVAVLDLVIMMIHPCQTAHSYVCLITSVAIDDYDHFIFIFFKYVAMTFGFLATIDLFTVIDLGTFTIVIFRWVLVASVMSDWPYVLISAVRSTCLLLLAVTSDTML